MLNSTISPVISTITIITTNNYTSLADTTTLRVFLVFYTYNSFSSLFSKDAVGQLTEVNNKHPIGTLVIFIFEVIQGRPCW